MSIIHGVRSGAVMASIRLQPPSSFDFKVPEEWPKWKKRFDQFRLASGLAAENDERQISTLLYCMGENAEETLSSMNISVDDRKKYDEVVAQFNAFFQVRQNVIFERARFNRRTQQADESVEQFITSLYTLAENCAYGDLKSEMIRDRIVVGIRDRPLSERLQLDAELTLEKAKTMVRQREAVHEQQSILHTPKEEKTVDHVRRKSPPLSQATGKKQYTQRPKRPSTNYHPSKSPKCQRCGKGQHPRSQCPAQDATCYKCNKKGHYGSMCLSKRVVTMSEEAETLETTYLDAVGSQQETVWKTDIHINGKSLSFKLDTGAEVTAVSGEAIKQLGQISLQKPKKILCGPDRKPLKVLGCVSLTLTHKGKTSRQVVYVIHKLKNNLLGLPAIQALHLLSKVEEVQNPTEVRVKARFPKLFQGLGTLEGEYEIKMQPDARPFALSTARNVPLPLRPKVKEELS